MNRFKYDLKEIRPHLVKKKVLSHQDKAYLTKWATNGYLTRHILRIQPLWLFSVFKFEEISQRKEIYVRLTVSMNGYFYNIQR